MLADVTQHEHLGADHDFKLIALHNMRSFER